MAEVRCGTCSSFYEERFNLMTGGVSWFPTCKHGVREAVVVENGEVVARASEAEGTSPKGSA
jgi:hypothetical protein